MKKTILLSLLVFFIQGCKKAEPPPVNEPIVEPQVPVGSLSTYDAVFSSLQSYLNTGGTYTLMSAQSFAIYSSQLINNEAFSSNNLNNIGTLSLNGVIFKSKNNVTNFYYNDTTNTPFSLPHKWKILGSTEVDSFSYANPNPFPVFNGVAFLPDSFSLKIGLQFTLKKITGCDLIKVSLLGGSGSTIFPNKLIAGTDSLINFTSEELEGLKPSNTAYFSVQFFKDNYRNINGKKVNFRTGLSYANHNFKMKL